MVEEKNGSKGNGNWLEEHDSIQMELLKMKNELMGYGKEEKRIPKTATDEDHDSSDESSLKGILAKSSPGKEMEDNDGSRLAPPPSVERALDERKKKEIESKSTEEDDEENDQAARLPSGKIPTSPDLTSKIAKVMQLENKLKRRKFELEKEGQKSKPPKPPVKKEEKNEDVGGTKVPVKNKAEPVDLEKVIPLPPPPKVPIEALEDTPELQFMVEEALNSTKTPTQALNDEEERSLKGPDDVDPPDDSAENDNDVLLKRRRKVTGPEPSQPGEDIPIEDDIYEFDDEVKDQERKPKNRNDKDNKPLIRLPRFLRRKKKM